MSVFDGIRGQEAIKKIFTAAAQTRQVSHAYLLVGETGSGRRALARAFAGWLACEDPGSHGPCGTCVSCMEAASGSHPDIITVKGEKASGLGVEEVRRFLVDDMAIRPYRAPYKLYIVEDADRMTLQAQNALLKTLEEPPEYGVIFLIAEKEDAFLPTILSRVMTLRMVPLPDAEVIRILKAEGIEESRAEILAAFARGNPGKAEMLSGSETFSERMDRSLSFLFRAGQASVGDLAAFQEFMKENREHVDEILRLMEFWYRDILMFKASGDPDLLILRGELREIRRAAEKCSFPGLTEIGESIRKMRERLAANVNFELAAELLLLSIKENLQ